MPTPNAYDTSTMAGRLPRTPAYVNPLTSNPNWANNYVNPNVGTIKPGFSSTDQTAPGAGAPRAGNWETSGQYKLPAGNTWATGAQPVSPTPATPATGAVAATGANAMNGGATSYESGKGYSSTYQPSTGGSGAYDPRTNAPDPAQQNRQADQTRAMAGGSTQTPMPGPTGPKQGSTAQNYATPMKSMMSAITGSGIIRGGGAAGEFAHSNPSKGGYTASGQWDANAAFDPSKWDANGMWTGGGSASAPATPTAGGTTMGGVPFTPGTPMGPQPGPIYRQPDGSISHVPSSPTGGALPATPGMPQPSPPVPLPASPAGGQPVGGQPYGTPIGGSQGDVLPTGSTDPTYNPTVPLDPSGPMPRTPIGGTQGDVLPTGSVPQGGSAQPGSPLINNIAGVTTPRDATGAGTTGGMANVGTSITPRQLFSPDDTAALVAAQAAQTMNDPNFLQKQFDRPGRSRDAGTMSLAMPGMAKAGAQAMNIMQTVPMQDALANQQFLLRGQTAQGQEGVQMANLLRRLMGVQDFETNQQQATLAGLL